jgi:Flp pilus assembly protein TadD
MRSLPSIALLLALGALGCRTASPTAYTPPSEERRDTARAEALTREAADLIASDPARAEALLRDALAADIFHGPAHNNLGVVFLERGELYEAAHEFEWARKLMPGHPDPRVNLALVMEEAGRTEDARGAYESALEVWPHHIAAIQGLAMLAVRAGESEPRLAEWLERIAVEGEDAGWREWARVEANKR